MRSTEGANCVRVNFCLIPLFHSVGYNANRQRPTGPHAAHLGVKKSKKLYNWQPARAHALTTKPIPRSREISVSLGGVNGTEPRVSPHITVFNTASWHTIRLSFSHWMIASTWISLFLAHFSYLPSFPGRIRFTFSARVGFNTKVVPS